MFSRKSISAFAVLLAVNTTLAQVPVTYQGQLKLNGTPVTNPQDLTFNLCSTDVGPGGVLQSAPVPQQPFNSDGTTAAIANFDTVHFNGQLLWLELRVGGTTLAPRQQVTYAPYSMFSLRPWATGGANISYSGGNVGIGTTTPTESLDVVGKIKSHDSFGQPTAGALVYGNNDGYLFIGPESGTSSNGAGMSVAGPLDTRTGVPGGFRFDTAGSISVIRDNGDVGIGTISPETRLNVVGGTEVTASTGGFIQTGAAGSASIAIDTDEIQARNNQTPATLALNIEGGDIQMCGNAGNVAIGQLTPTERLHVQGNIRATGSVFASCGTLSCSDARYKKNIMPFEGGLGLVQKLRPVLYDWRCDEFPEWSFSTDRQVGLVAQDVRDVAPEVVHQGSDGYYAIDYSRLTPVVVQAIQEQQQTIKRQQETIAGLDAARDCKDAEIADLAARLAQLEASVSKLAALKTTQD